MDNLTFFVCILIIFIVVVSLLWIFLGGGNHKFEGLHFLDPPVCENKGDVEYEEVVITDEDSETCQPLMNINIKNEVNIKNEDLDIIECIPSDVNIPLDVNIPVNRIKLSSLNLSEYENFSLEGTGAYKKHMDKKTAAESRGEKICRNVLEKFFNKPFQTCRPDFLMNPESGKNLELDCYNEELGLALEYNGIQHYVFPNKFHKTQDDFEQQVRRDEFKKNACQTAGIYLIIVPYSIPHNKLPKYIEYYLPENVLHRREHGIEESTEDAFWEDKAPLMMTNGYV